MKAPMPYHGGKFHLADWITRRLDTTKKSYGELFLGMGSVLLAKTPSQTRDGKRPRPECPLVLADRSRR